MRGRLVSPIEPTHLLRQEPFNAWLAFIDLHIADTGLNLVLDDTLDRFTHAYLLRRVRGPVPVRLRRQLLRLGASEEGQEEILRGEGEATVEAICGWVEQKRAYGKTYPVFHSGAAGLTQLECQVLDLSQRFLTEMGRPDFVRIVSYLSGPRGQVTRQSALHTLRRAREKVESYLKRESMHEEAV